jgi:hypothetical protein
MDPVLVDQVLRDIAGAVGDQGDFICHGIPPWKRYGINYSVQFYR